MNSFDETKLRIVFELPEDLEMLKNIVSTFELSIKTEMKNLMIAFFKKDVIQIRTALHKMIGSAGCVAATTSFETLQAMRNFAHENDIASISDLIPKLQKEFKILTADLQFFINNCDESFSFKSENFNDK